MRQKGFNSSYLRSNKGLVSLIFARLKSAGIVFNARKTSFLRPFLVSSVLILLGSVSEAKSSAPNQGRSQSGTTLFDPYDAAVETKRKSDVVNVKDFPLAALKLQDKLVGLAKEYASLAHVPYVWGGGNIGKVSSCDECRTCIETKKYSIKNRLRKCKACQSCGIDCSHFVNRVFNQVGLEYPYAATAEMKRARPEELATEYNLLHMGKDIRAAQPGDLLVYKNHVVLLASIDDKGYGEIIHATRFIKGRKSGGIAWDKQKRLATYRGKLQRILRHRGFYEASAIALNHASMKYLHSKPSLPSAYFKKDMLFPVLPSLTHFSEIFTNPQVRSF
jgi:cell wall-associated NlpC family hydrolase